MTLQPFTKEQVNYFKFAHIVTNEFPKALRQSFKYLWDTTYGHRPGYRSWDDSKEVREMFLREEGGTTDVPTNLSYTEWDCSKLFQATIYSQSFSEEDSEGRKTSLSEKYVKPRRLAEGELLTSIGISSTSVTERFTIAINQLRILRNILFQLTKAEIDTKTFRSYIQLSEKAFNFLNVATASINAISSYSEDDFPTEKARKIGEDIVNYMGTESGHIRDKFLKGCEVLAAESLRIAEERSKEFLESMIAIFGNREKVVHKLFELIKSGVYFRDTGDFEPVSEKISVTDHEKRWFLIGIALQKILFQHIRPHVKQRMLQVYGQESYVEDCKKIVRKTSGHYYGDIKSFDEFDLRAILELLSDFDSPLHCPAAIDVRDVRNDWVHVLYSHWTMPMLMRSFMVMEEIVKEMCLPGEDQWELLESLGYLKIRGVYFRDTGDFEPVSEKISVTEHQKRWFVTGIAFQKILFQHIRPHVKQRMLQIYGQESYVEDCKKIVRKTSGHCYGDIKSFDEFDLRAILELLSDFDSPLHCPAAIDVRDLRNDWVHVLYSHWTMPMLMRSFIAMEKLVKEMCLPGEDQWELLESLRYLKYKGKKLCSNYGAKTSLENQVKQLRDDVNDKLENVIASLVSIASVLRDEKKPDQQLIEGETKLTEDTSSERLGERLCSNYGAKTSLENQVKQLRDDVNDKLENVIASLVSIASVLRDEKKPDQQLIGGETKLTEDTSSERLEKSLSRSKIGEVKDSTSLEEVSSVLKGKQQTEEQRGEDESESFEETLDENQATSPSTIYKGKDSTSLEEVISVPVDKQQTEEQSGEDESELFKETHSVGPETSLSRLKIGEVKDPTSLEEVTSVPKDKQQTEEQRGEDESESFEETLGENQATSPSTIDEGKDSASLEEVISVPMDKKQTEEQSGEDESESFKITLGVGPVAQDHDIKGKTTTFEAEHKECIRVLPYTDASGQVYVQLYVFCAKNDIPKDLKEDAQEFFGETGVELRWTNLYNYASNVPSIVSKEFEQLEVSQVNDIAKIIDKNLSVFSKHRNITAIHPYLKVTNSKQTKSPCIRVYVLGKGCIPVDESEIPKVVENCLVDIVDGFWCETLDTFKPLTAHKQEKYLRLGASIGVKETNNAGTLGAIVKDNEGRFYLLSVNHVINQEQSREIIHPGLLHYLASLKHHLIHYHSWINRIFKLEHVFRHDHPNLEIYFSEMKNQVDLLLTSDGDRHPKLTECEEQLGNLFSKPPRTVAYFKDHVSQVSTSPNNLRIYVEAAVAELTCEEKDALIENGYVEIIDTGDYPDGRFSNDAADNYEREWRKSGSSTGYTSLKSFITFKVFLRISEHEIVPFSALDNVMWRPNGILLLNNGNLFSYHGDSGAVIFEKTDPRLQAMRGFGIITGGLFSNHVCVGTLAVPLCEALGLLSDKLDSELALVSAM